MPRSGIGNMNLRRLLLTPYHFAWALFSALFYDFPASKIVVVGITGTKGKSSVAEMLHAVLSAAGHKTALAGTIRFAIGADSKPNLYKMTLPGRGFIQRFLARAVREGATHAIVELTSESALQYRHQFLSLNALIFTNLQKEHVEAHGSFEKYFAAKYELGKELVASPKRPRAIVANTDDARGKNFLSLPVEERVPFSLADLDNLQVSEKGVAFAYRGTLFEVPQPGRFSAMNALAAIKAAEFLDVPLATCARALGALVRIPGRAERIEAGQSFAVVVDYAHTPDSLRALYGAFPNRRKICVLGNTGGGRDRWKRPEMGRIAEEACAEVILTNEDPYDENPERIVHDIMAGMRRPHSIIMDRRTAIHAALEKARAGDAVLITGKGTDPYIMGPAGTKMPWSDGEVVREELEKLLAKS